MLHSEPWHRNRRRCYVCIISFVTVWCGWAARGGDTGFRMVADGASPYPLNDRNNLSVNCGGGKGVLISRLWVLTASHCITSRKQKSGDVKVRFTKRGGGGVTIRVVKVVRHGDKDLALLKLARPVKPEERPPLLLLRQRLVRSDGRLQIKKVAGSVSWRKIPAIGTGDHLAVPKKSDRKGKAGTSGAPWVIHSTAVGDVLVGITHGGGRAPQVAYVASWIQQHTGGEVVWATKVQTLTQSSKSGQRDRK